LLAHGLDKFKVQLKIWPKVQLFPQTTKFLPSFFLLAAANRR